MKSLAVDEKKRKRKDYVINIALTIICIVGMVTLYRMFEDSSLRKEKINAIKIEQARNNVKIAEEMVAKELNTDSKYFRMISKSGVIFKSYDQYLDANTNAYWVDQKLKAQVKVDKESYIVHFETKRISNNEDNLEMYKPTGIYKVLKEE